MGKAEKITQMTSGEIVRALLANGLTLQEISEATGIDQGGLSRLSRDERALGEDRFRKLAAFGLKKNIF